MTNAALDVALLLRPTHQAEQRREGIVADQRLITLVQAAFAAGEQLRRHRLRVVPPQLVRHAAEKGKGFDQAVQDGLGAFRWQGQGERAIRVGPRRHQDRDQTPAVGEINVNMAEVALQPLAGIVVQRDKGLASPDALGQQVASHPLVGAAIALFVTETAKDFGGRVALLAGRLLILFEDSVDDGLEGIKDGGQGPSLVGLGFGVSEDLPYFASGVMKASRQFADAHLFLAIGLSNACIFVHVNHPPPPVAGTALLQ